MKEVLASDIAIHSPVGLRSFATAKECQQFVGFINDAAQSIACGNSSKGMATETFQSWPQIFKFFREPSTSNNFRLRQKYLYPQPTKDLELFLLRKGASQRVELKIDSEDIPKFADFIHYISSAVPKGSSYSLENSEMISKLYLFFLKSDYLAPLKERPISQLERPCVQRLQHACLLFSTPMLAAN